MKNKIRNFQIQTRLGSGSYGVIFKAINKSDKSQWVLKQIRMNKMSQKAKKSTLNQATIMGKLIHPFIVQYKDSFVQEDTLHIVMQYCDNGDLSMFLKMQNKKPLKQQKIWKFFIQICLGLQYIHKNKILHRDIKTLNIFLNKNEDVKIGDLGVAKMLMSNDFAQTIVGTPFYLSPQLCQQKPYNQKSDIWALGCLLYQLCTFKHPFEAANQASLILKIIRGKYSAIPQFYSKQLKDTIDMCLQRDYKRRPTASMILQRAKIKEFTKEFKLEEKIRQQYDRINSSRVIKQALHKQQQILQGKRFQDSNPATQVQKRPVQSAAKKNQNRNKIAPQNQVKRPQNQVKRPQNQVKRPQNQVKRPSEEQKILIMHQKRPSISGMPQNNIILPDKNKIIQKLQPNNRVKFQRKETQFSAPMSQKKVRQNKEQFLRNLQKAVDQDKIQKSPFKGKIKGEELLAQVVSEQKSRLQKIDMKIQEQLKKQQQIQKQRVQNQRKKAENINLVSPRIQVKNFNIAGEHKIVPPMIPPLPPKNKQQIIKVRMQQPQVAAKVFNIIGKGSSQPKGNKGIIKSRGFTQQIIQQEQNEKYSVNKSKEQRRGDSFKQQHRNSSQNNVKPVLFGLQEQQKPESSSPFLNKHKQQPSCLINKSTAQYQSQRNIKLLNQQQQIAGSSSRITNKKEPQRYLFKKKAIGVSVHNNQINSRVRKGSACNSNSNKVQLSRNARNLSKLTQVTKQDQDLVMNLPQNIRNKDMKNESSSDEQADGNGTRMSRKPFRLKEVNNELVLQKYEQILGTQSIRENLSQGWDDQIRPQSQGHLQRKQKQQHSTVSLRINKNLNEYDQQQQNGKFYSLPQQRVSDQQLERLARTPSPDYRQDYQYEELIEQNQSLALKQRLNLEDFDEDTIYDESEEVVQCEQREIQDVNWQDRHGDIDIEEHIYEVNRFQMDDQQTECQGESQGRYQDQRGSLWDNLKQQREQWQFDEQPQLPMLQDRQSPFFEQANPYLIPQAQQESIQQKRNYLQIRLQQNIKREDQINKLMQIKIEECKAMVPKYFEEILQFFRVKINKQEEYTETDQKEVEEFLKRKGLTDQSKFQNIYKIMHFQMELENTRKIIQRICKKLGQLDDQSND